MGGNTDVKKLPMSDNGNGEYEVLIHVSDILNPEYEADKFCKVLQFPEGSPPYLPGHHRGTAIPHRPAR